MTICEELAENKQTSERGYADGTKGIRRQHMGDTQTSQRGYTDSTEVIR